MSLNKADAGFTGLAVCRVERPLLTFLRYWLYVSLLCGLIFSVWFIVCKQGIDAMQEGPIEHLGLFVLVLSFLVLSLRFLMAPQLRAASAIMANLVLLVMIRELNDFLENVLPVVGWKGPALIAAAWGLYYAWRKRRIICQSMAQVISCQAWPFFCCAFLVAIPFAQLIGNGELLSTIMGGEYNRDYKQAIEEIGELFGAGLLLIGAVEMVWRCRREREQSIPSRRSLRDQL